MKKYLYSALFSFSLLFSISAQIPGFKKTNIETTTIEGYRLSVGDTLQLGFGSGANNEFIFFGTFVGKGLMGIPSVHASAQYANTQIVVLYFAKIKGFSELVPVCKPVLGSQKVWLYPQLGNAILKEEILWEK